MKQFVLLAVLAATTSGCLASQFRQTGLKRAAFDLQCPEDQLTLEELSAKQMGVRGCGRQTVYVLVGPFGDQEWINNGASAPPSGSSSR